jgi:hypothetical protein
MRESGKLKQSSARLLLLSLQRLSNLNLKPTAVRALKTAKHLNPTSSLQEYWFKLIFVAVQRAKVV